MSTQTVLVLSDVHYAGEQERLRLTSQTHSGTNSLFQLLNRGFGKIIHSRTTLTRNQLLDKFISDAGNPDRVIANGDYSCDSAFVGVSDDAAFASAEACLGKLRGRFGERFIPNYGDHELGKTGLLSGNGGMRLASWHRAHNDLQIPPGWRIEMGNYVLIGVVSSLVGLPVFARDILPEERDEWLRLQHEHMEQIRGQFSSLRSNQRVILFCHDPSALTFLGREEIVRKHLVQVDQTIIGHYHTPLIHWTSRRLAGMPPISFLGKAVQRNTTALREGKYWRPFNVRLCPSLAGIQLLKDGGYYSVELDLEARQPARFTFHPLSWEKASDQ